MPSPTPPVIVSIAPIYGISYSGVNPCLLTVTGTGFKTGDFIQLKMTGQTTINATNVIIVSTTQITCSVDLSNAQQGRWDVVVTSTDNPALSSTLSAALSVIIFEPLKIVADIIQSELGLTDSQVIIYNQKFNIPNIPGLFIVLSVASEKIVSTSNSLDVDGNEIQQVATMSQFQIDVMSQNDEARQRRFEVIAALNSIAMNNICELYNMRVSNIPSAFLDASGVEGTARLNRYLISINVNSLYTKSKVGKYYTTLTPDEEWIDKKPA